MIRSAQIKKIGKPTTLKGPWDKYKKAINGEGRLSWKKDYLSLNNNYTIQNCNISIINLSKYLVILSYQVNQWA